MATPTDGPLLVRWEAIFLLCLLSWFVLVIVIQVTHFSHLLGSVMAAVLAPGMIMAVYIADQVRHRIRIYRQHR